MNDRFLLLENFFDFEENTEDVAPGDLFFLSEFFFEIENVLGGEWPGLGETGITAFFAGSHIFEVDGLRDRFSFIGNDGSFEGKTEKRVRSEKREGVEWRS